MPCSAAFSRVASFTRLQVRFLASVDYKIDAFIDEQNSCYAFVGSLNQRFRSHQNGPNSLTNHPSALACLSQQSGSEAISLDQFPLGKSQPLEAFA